MTLSPLWRTRFFAAGAAVLAVWLGVDLAYREFVFPGLCAGALAIFLLARFQPLPIEALLTGIAMAGYVIGNRGFAQISLAGHFPLLPGEAVLVLGGAILLVRTAWRRELPFRRDPLNLLLLAWMTFGALRLLVDVHHYGFLALRDFALVYYAAYFFLGQEIANDARAARFCENILLASCVIMLPLYVLTHEIPIFFLTELTVQGEPVIYYKDDLAGLFLMIGSVLAFLRFEERRRWWSLVISPVLAGSALTLANRAAMLALATATLWLLLGRRWRFAAMLSGSGIMAIVVILAGASALRIPWERTPVLGVYEGLVSLTDPTGARQYKGSETFNKGDNNRFRWVWWHAVVDETVEADPYFGLGFGADLASRFAQEYYPEGSDEFPTRSPHNVLLTIFARLGAVGLIAFLGVVAIVTRETWQAVRAGPRLAAPWCAVWAIFTSACLGVVLEGPMGAVIFWTILGLAHRSLQQHRAGIAAAAEPPVDAPALAEAPVQP
ncbi:MAG TPA: O-antigen ligase family protein [Opitutus sp.]|nr:O-antigen ligase family protein [Opitutus sp.]